MKSMPYPVPQVNRELADLGKCLKLSRLRRGMSQEELAIRCNVARETIARLESCPGKVSLEIFFTALYMLDRLDEINGFMNPENDIAAMGAEASQLLDPGGKGRLKDSSGFDWATLENLEAVSPLTGEKYHFGK